MFRKERIPALILMLISLAAAPGSWASGETPAAADLPYRVVDGKVDPNTFVGWRLFHDTCVRCHDVGATGSAVAPNLVERVHGMGKQEFTMKVLERYAVSVPQADAVAEDRTAIRRSIMEEIRKSERAKAGEVVMPKWENNPMVREHISHIYAYLRARADGVLGPGKPEILR